METIFEITAEQMGTISRDTAVAQVSRALQQRTELTSREHLPGLWRLTDQLNERQRVSKSVLKRRRIRTGLLSILCASLGVFLLIPALMAPFDLTLVICSIVSIGLGSFNLWNLWRPRSGKNGFEKPAAQLLDKLYALPREITIRIAFTDSEMLMENITAGTLQSQDAIPYTEIETAFEAEDIYLLTYAGKGMVLPKRCMTAGTAAHFRDWLSSKTAFVQL